MACLERPQLEQPVLAVATYCKARANYIKVVVIVAPVVGDRSGMA